MEHEHGMGDRECDSDSDVHDMSSVPNRPGGRPPAGLVSPI